MPTMKISTTIKKKFFEMKMVDLEKEGYFIEYKEDKPFWKKRIDTLLKEYDLRAYGFLGELPEIVFLVGNKPYRFQIINIFYEKNVPEIYKTAINTSGVFALKCVPISKGGNRPRTPLRSVRGIHETNGYFVLWHSEEDA